MDENLLSCEKRSINSIVIGYLQELSIYETL